MGLHSSGPLCLVSLANVLFDQATYKGSIANQWPCYCSERMKATRTSSTDSVSSTVSNVSEKST